ncbi:MAG: membrane protein insertion efficiency factor YidD [Lachnospiraceae bacterium]|jgi:putative membrane protein insertion efficiency factor|nr:membrane protein insertion efficiency factor YidD [Lachnospiraceae bacterium]
MKKKNYSINFVNSFLIGSVKFYRGYLSPMKMTPCCRYFPTCSEYALEALKKYGAVKGSFLSVKRILRCNHFSKGGYDPVP